MGNKQAISKALFSFFFFFLTTLPLSLIDCPHFYLSSKSHQTEKKTMTKLDAPTLPAAGTTKAAAVHNLLVKSVMTTVDGVAYSTDPWTNWAGNVTSNPERTFHPKTLHDLQVIVREANAHNKKIRCAGSGHSWSTVASTNDYLVDVKGMNKIHTPISSENGWTVTIEMGVLVSELDNALRQNNPPLALPSNVVPNEVCCCMHR